MTCERRFCYLEMNKISEKARILIVDDDKSILSSLSAILRREGYIIDEAETGSEAVEKTKANFYNLTLMDFRLPDIEGTQLLTQIKDTVPKMRKVIMTGYPTLSNAVESVNFGADAYVMKPFILGELLEKIKEQLRKQAEERDYSQAKVAEFIKNRCAQLESDEK